jgi:hypothetical protein
MSCIQEPELNDSVGEARQSISRYLDFYNGRRPHSSLDCMTPYQAYSHRAADPHGNITSADDPLNDADFLFRHPGRLHFSERDLDIVWEWHGATVS